MKIFKNIISFEGSKFNFNFRSKKHQSGNKEYLDKNNTRILFIDDDKFPVVNNLVNAGWGACRISDVNNLQDDEIKRANIIFVDYKGVGKKFTPSDEGIGLIKALKNTYGNEKRIILYSGYSEFPIDVNFELADARLSKTSDLYEFIRIIESEIKKLNDLL